VWKLGEHHHLRHLRIPIDMIMIDMIDMNVMIDMIPHIHEARGTEMIVIIGT
jgi:hypothetical protein